MCVSVCPHFFRAPAPPAPRPSLRFFISNRHDLLPTLALASPMARRSSGRWEQSLRDFGAAEHPPAGILNTFHTEQHAPERPAGAGLCYFFVFMPQHSQPQNPDARGLFPPRRAGPIWDRMRRDAPSSRAAVSCTDDSIAWRCSSLVLNKDKVTYNPRDSQSAALYCYSTFILP